MLRKCRYSRSFVSYVIALGASCSCRRMRLVWCSVTAVTLFLGLLGYRNYWRTASLRGGSEWTKWLQHKLALSLKGKSLSAIHWIHVDASDVVLEADASPQGKKFWCLGGLMPAVSVFGCGLMMHRPIGAHSRSTFSSYCVWFVESRQL